MSLSQVSDILLNDKPEADLLKWKCRNITISIII